ncbi:MAG: hypothetical protein A3F89_06130 [Deltaproteobacteria bacterium RIFCSPLOWO2_12_FULL_50_11]|nr:MAG: hypothetical protein A3F89_06130 [Deltaproteobacteria bacterium RIFCSPLOWO2_12_FULL_50_11]
MMPFMKSLPKKIETIHCIAICGMGMGSLAGLLKQAGYHVTGSDQNIYPPMSDQLKQLKIPVRAQYAPENIPQDVDLIVIGNAVSKNNVEVEEVLHRGLPYLSMPEACHHFFLKEKTSLVVAGTHGKTTTSSLLAWILYKLGRDPSFLIGGILNNFEGAYRLGRGDEMVMEGDEYDSAFFDKGPKFFHYNPKVLIITSLEYDHADIYHDMDSLRKNFKKLIQLVPQNGRWAACIDFPEVAALMKDYSGSLVTYSTQGRADYEARHIDIGESGTKFDLFIKGKFQASWVSPLIGSYNVANVLGALILLDYLEIPLSGIQGPLLEFRGVKRRQEIRGIVKDRIVIDDFAHHPTAVRATLEGLKARYPEYRLWALFEPRSQTSRRRVFQDQFAEALSLADKVLVAPPYQVEKIPEEERLDPYQLCQKIKSLGKEASLHSGVDSMVTQVVKESRAFDLIVIMSNGGFDGIYEKMLEGLKELA